MADRLRSTEAPMDFEFTSRPSSNMPKSWVEEPPSTSRKRTHDDLNPPTPLFPEANPPATVFGINQNSTPFLFHTPPLQTPHVPDWTPPPNFSAARAFPSQQEPNDVCMAEISPPKPAETPAEVPRAVALGGMRRVFKSRLKARGSPLPVIQSREGRDEITCGSESDEEHHLTPLTQNTSNHYTLNMPTPPAPPSDTPYVLLGYLQVFFNLCLISLFLYLVLQFILTVQRDVEQRISEYSMDMVQEIALCALHYRNNLCASNPIPAMAQQCGSWETCMQRDPAIIGRAKVGAELIAEVVNSFVEPISWKTLAFTLTSLSFLTVFINALLSLYRSKYHAPPSTAVPVHPSFPVQPTTPYHAHHFGGYLSPNPTPAWGRSWNPMGEEQMPTRRRRLEGGGAAKIK